MKKLYKITIISLMLITLVAISKTNREPKCVYFDTAGFDGEAFIIENCDGTYTEFKIKVKDELIL